MSGPDTARGINFQYACAISFILDFPSHLDWQVIQMEGDENIEDVTILDQNAQPLLRAQIKQKRDPKQWRPHEWRDVFATLAECPDSGTTQYYFIYSGSEGQAIANKLKPVLQKLQYEGREALSPSETQTLNDAFGNQVVEFLLHIEHRLSLQKRETWRSIEAQDLRRLRKLLNQSDPPHLEEDYEVKIYNSLLREVALKTEGEVKYFRRLTRKQIYDLLQIGESVSAQSSFEVSQYTRWLRETASAWFPAVELALQREASVPAILNLAVGLESESGLGRSEKPTTLPRLVEQVGQIVVVGEPGSGKSVALWQLAVHQSQRLDKGPRPELSSTLSVPVYVSLAGYAGEAIDRLVGQAFHTAGQILEAGAIHDLARRGALLLLFDDFDLAKANYRPDLLLQLKSWKSTYPKCLMVISTHNPSDGHKLQLPTYRLLSLTQDQAREVLLDLGMDEGDTLAILNSLPADSKHLISSPLTLRMLAYVYQQSERRVPKSRSPLYEEVIKGILARSEEKGLIEFERSDKLGVLAQFARWMQNDETYLVSPSQASSLISDWIADENNCFRLAHLVSCDQLHLRNELLHSGLLRTTLDGDIEFIHPTFRAYLAALTISVNDLPAILDRSSWRVSILLWASLRSRDETDALMDFVVERPILLGHIMREREDKRREIPLATDELELYFERLNGVFNQFVRRFPILLQDPPWSGLTEGQLTLLAAKSSVSGYMLTWQVSQTNDMAVQWTTCAEILRRVRDVEPAFPLPLWLLPGGIVQRYHPLEVVYHWMVRSLFDLLVFIRWQGGLDVTRFGQQIDSHPAVALVANRFLLYQEVASKLPKELRDELPFYARQEYDLAIEVHEYVSPPRVRYAVVIGREPGEISLFQSILREPHDDQLLFKQAEDGSWYLQVSGTTHPAVSVEEIGMDQLMTELTGNAAQQWLKNDLERYLPGFPPATW